mmetsp:Transcript_7866/g.33086  ORF Transcript_7866/g.33086 Transcript_7866/m.33086 type:complete len:309 (-) Transcript_7866:1279-2205(-)
MAALDAALVLLHLHEEALEVGNALVGACLDPGEGVVECPLVLVRFHKRAHLLLVAGHALLELLLLLCRDLQVKLQKSEPLLALGQRLLLLAQLLQLLLHACLQLLRLVAVDLVHVARVLLQRLHLLPEAQHFKGNGLALLLCIGQLLLCALLRLEQPLQLRLLLLQHLLPLCQRLLVAGHNLHEELFLLVGVLQLLLGVVESLLDGEQLVSLLVTRSSDVEQLLAEVLVLEEGGVAVSFVAALALECLDELLLLLDGDHSVGHVGKGLLEPGGSPRLLLDCLLQLELDQLQLVLLVLHLLLDQLQLFL